MLCLLPGGLVDEGGTVHNEVQLRGLSGREEELLASRNGATGASLTTAILSRCVERIGGIGPIDPEIAGQLLVADRQFLLLKLREATFGDQVRGSVPCPWPNCGQRVAVSFATGDVPVEPSIDKGPTYTRVLSPEALPGVGEARRTITFRLPNGLDQEAVSPIVAENEAMALTSVLARCVLRIGSEAVDGGGIELTPLARREIEQHMEDVAPHLDLLMEVTCAECGRGFCAPFDLQRFFFGELRVTEDMLYGEVHYLAFYYHWSEREIMEMTRDRRRRYIDILGEEIERLNEAI